MNRNRLLGWTALALLAPMLQAAEPGDYRGIRRTGDDADPSTYTPPRMTLVPGGTATIGLDEEEIQALKLDNVAWIKLFAASVPKHQVQLAPYYLDTFEVTNRQWKIYLDATGQAPSADLVELWWPEGRIPEGMEDYPVVAVSYPEVVRFCRWAGRRLPTEEEWEYAARGPDAYLWPWGNEFDEPIPPELRRRPRTPEEAVELERKRAELMTGGRRAWCAESTYPRNRRHAQRVGSRPEGRSPFGLFDMAGNVWEWTSSPFLPYEGYRDIRIRSKITRNRPETYSAAEFFNSTRMVIRGGAFDSPPLALIGAVRQFADRETWFNTIGFRTAKSVQAGLDTIDYALSDVGSYTFHEKAAPLARMEVQAVERTDYDPDGYVTGFRSIAFAPVLAWPKWRLKEAQKESISRPVPIGLATFTEPCVVPAVPPGTYVVAYQAPDTKWKEPPGFEVPSEGWVYPGWQQHEPNYRPPGQKKQKGRRKKARSRKNQAAAAKDAEGVERPGEEEDAEEADAQVRFQAAEGSVVYDHRLHNIVLLDPSGRIRAAVEIDPPKEASRDVPTTMQRNRIAADVRRKLPATERYRYSFAVMTKGGRKFVPFELDLRFEPKLFDGPAGPKNVSTGEPPEGP